MKTITRWIVSSILCAAAACTADGGDRADDGSSGGEAGSSGDMSTTIPTTTTTTTVGTTDATTASTTDSTDTGMDTSTGDEPFDFDDSPPEEYTQADRMGMPAVATMLITSDDDYDHATPADDIMADFVPEIVDSLTALHAALDDDLAGLELTPCDVDTCAGQVVPLVVPDVLHIELAEGSGFPNGRRLEDPVIDIMLAVILLDLEAHDVDTLLQVPVNPTANDVPLSSQFPYMAEPH